ncbi:hypothetical protein WMO40_20955 [Bacillaceae bacterium CLA-AA-H227]|uniref:Uncharacterized protein n=1 Tax=Robertmurraya yapensis (ex Hitch et al 2024) TaxID=3133160 RepID=A0ACC6SH55_9BACI
MDENKVTNIKYKQMDKDPEIKKVTNSMEKLILGEKGVGLMDALGLTPGRIQKYLDDSRNEEFEQLLDEHKEYIFWESRKRSAKDLESYMKEHTFKSIDDMTNKLEEFLKKSEIEVIQELVNEYLK